MDCHAADADAGAAGACCVAEKSRQMAAASTGAATCWHNSVGRQDQTSAELVSAYATEMGLSKRTARMHRQRAVQSWRDFLRARGLAPSGAPRADKAPLREMSDLEKATESERISWDLLCGLQRDAAAASDPSAKAVLMRACKDATMTHKYAAAHLVDARKEASELVSAGAVRAVMQRAAGTLADIHTKQRNEIAHLLDDTLRPLFLAAWSRTEGARQRALSSLNSELEALITHD